MKPSTYRIPSTIRILAERRAKLAMEAAHELAIILDQQRTIAIENASRGIAPHTATPSEAAGA